MVDEREQAPGLLGVAYVKGEVPHEIGPLLHEPVHASREVGQLIQQFFFQRLNGKERDEAHQRANLEGNEIATRAVDGVVVEPVSFIPEARTAALLVDGVGDIDEVLEEFGGYVLVSGLCLGELQRHRQHVEAEHAHPGGTVGLLQVPARG